MSRAATGHCPLSITVAGITGIRSVFWHANSVLLAVFGDWLAGKATSCDCLHGVVCSALSLRLRGHNRDL
jgi:hypothetical protein